MDRLESFGLLREVDTEAGTVTAVISTGNIARDGAIIDPKGWDFSNYNNNPVVLWMHDDTSMPFARTIEGPRADGDELVAKAQFDMDDPQAVEALRKISKGYINATSVRWIPHASEMRKVRHGDGDGEEPVLVFTESELLEWSFVAIPADPGAVIVRSDGTALDVADYAQVIDPARKEPESVTTTTHGVADYFINFDMDAEGMKRISEEMAERLAERRSKPDDMELIEGAVAMYSARRSSRKTPEEMAIDALSRATGKTPERLRRELVGGR